MAESVEPGARRLGTLTEALGLQPAPVDEYVDLPGLDVIRV